MKTLTIILTACLLIGAAKGQTNSTEPVAKTLSPEQEAIAQTMRQALDALTNSVIVMNRQKVFSDKKFVEFFSQIDTQKCPKDYRLAWSDLLFAMQERMKIRGSLGELVTLFIAPTRGIAEVNQKAEKSAEADAKIREAIHELDRLLIKYDLK